MKINYNVQGKERKTLVNIIAEAIDETAVYEKAPTYAFTIGAFTVTREGAVECDDETVHEDEINAVIAALEEAGYEGEDGEDLPDNAEEENEGEDSPQAEDEGENGADLGETEAVIPQGEDGVLTISYPLGGFTPESLENLNKMVKSKEPLIKKALGVDELPIQVGEDEIGFPWFKLGIEQSDMLAYAQFIERLCKTALAKKRVTATAPDSFENPRFSCRVWLISLGLVGVDYALCRKLLMQNLEGNSGFRYEDKQPRNPRGGERVQKEVLSIRLTLDVLEKVAELASQSGMSRNAFIESIVGEYVQGETSADDTDGGEE